MEQIPLLGREALELARRGDIEQALAAARRAVSAHPEDFGLRVFLAMLHVRRGELSDALPHLRSAIAINPADPFPQAELVRVLIGLGQLDEASAALDQLRAPEAQALRLRATLLYRRGDVASAGSLYEQLVRADARDFESWGNLGLCLLAADRTAQAVGALERSLELRPNNLPIRLKWVETRVALGTGEQALSELRAVAITDPTGTLDVAVAHLEDLLGRPLEGLTALRESVRKNGTNPDALAALAAKLEQLNDLDGYEDIVGRLAALPQSSEKLPLLQARLAYRRGDYDRALTLAQSAPTFADVGTRAQLIGQSLDKLGHAQAAFDAFLEMNWEDGRTGGAVEAKAADSRASLDEQLQILTPEWVGRWKESTAPGREPVFLLGFPRSGTTLLDTLLMGHPATTVAEEEPMLAQVGEKIGDIARLAEMSAAEVDELRRFYFEIAEQHAPGAGRKLLIDKNPLAMGALPVIHRLFPTAPIIFMERHPCDVVLSCFMTRFEPTGVGANFLTIENIARLYDGMMRLWTRAADLLPLRTHIVRYERLVDDLEAELRPLAEFLAIDWQAGLLDHRDTAKKRHFIKTPSYAQVTEPVNRKAVGRWARYRAELEPVLGILEPWVRRMGYEI